MAPVRKSQVWKYFEKEGDLARCLRCENTTIVAKHGTHSLWKHATGQHGIKRKAEDPEEDLSNENDFEGESLGKILSRSAVVDNMSFRTISKSLMVKYYVESKKFVMPKSVSTVRRIIVDYAKNQQEVLKNKIIRDLSQGFRFSFSVDEWTDVAQRRYMNITLFGIKNEKYELGLFKVDGRCTADNVGKMVRKNLGTYNLNLKSHIVASINDGASVIYQRNFYITQS